MDRDLIQQIEEAAVLSLDSIRHTLRAAMAQYNAGKPYEQSCYVYDVIGDDSSGDVIVEMGGQLHRAPYTMEASAKKRSVSVKMSKAERVYEQKTYVLADGMAIEASREKLKRMLPQAPHLAPHIEPTAVEESEVIGDCVPLREGAVGQDGTMKVKLIAPGKGSSGIYTEAVLQQAARDRVFSKGLHMYWNHQTPTEEAERPEGDLRDLAGVLAENAYFDAKGPAGPGLYAKAKATEAYAQSIDNLAPSIGVSIRAFGPKRPSKDGPVIEKISRAISCDFVTRAGAGGKVLQLFEAARPQSQPKESDMDKAEVQALITESLKPFQEQVTAQAATISTLTAENLKLKEAGAKTQAREIIAAKVRAEKALPLAAQARVVEAILGRALPLAADGSLDTAKLEETIKAEVKAEAEYLAQFSESGTVRGMGPATEEPKPEDVRKRIEERTLAIVGGQTPEQKRFAEAYAKGRD